MNKEDKICVDCGKKGVHERNRCYECALIHNRQRAKEHYQKHGRTKKVIKCKICDKNVEIDPWNYTKGQRWHLSCKNEIIAPLPPENGMHKYSGNYHARKTVKQLGINKPKGWITHHVDGNTFNNYKENLWVMSRKEHRLLHAYLDTIKIQKYIKLYKGNTSIEIYKQIWESDFVTYYNNMWLEENNNTVIFAKDYS